MRLDLTPSIDRYAELIVKIALNVQPGQRLLVGSPRRYVPLECAPFVRMLARHAYQVGAAYVEVLWGDDGLTRTRLEYARRDSFGQGSPWRGQVALEYAQNGDALVSISAEDPDLLKGQDPALVSQMQHATLQISKAFADHNASQPLNGTVVSVPTPGWAAKVFPNLPPEQQQERLWQAILAACRVDAPDPVAAWQTHIRQIRERGVYLTAKQYTAMHFRGPGTDLSVGLPAGHAWVGGQAASHSGIQHVPNFPTEEIFSLPHRERVEGHVTTTKPFVHAGRAIEKFTLSFSAGRVVKISADQGEETLRHLIETDEGAARLGEVALVAHSSPISQSGILFYNTLFDENAADHIALGRAYKQCLQGGPQMNDEAFNAAGGNLSLTHNDFMIGSAEIDVDGVLADGRRQPVMRQGEWAF
ncbi:MAG TPA: aminopeptidase [Anaerolineales bacterium]|nr:aminopeptidase [Anaerolineales bacterium]